MRDGVDGLVTTEPDTPLMALSADCPLLLLFDARQRVLALAHSGWRGTLAGMPTRLVEAMGSKGGAHPEDLLAVISPSARACCYEIKDDVREQVARTVASPDRFIRREGGRMFLDLGGLIAAQLSATGVPAKAIHLPEQCSICDERFYSYRRQGPDVGHAALVAGMR
jgi:hypothetical protein